MLIKNMKYILFSGEASIQGTLYGFESRLWQGCVFWFWRHLILVKMCCLSSSEDRVKVIWLSTVFSHFSVKLHDRIRVRRCCKVRLLNFDHLHHHTIGAHGIIPAYLFPRTYSMCWEQLLYSLGFGTCCLLILSKTGMSIYCWRSTYRLLEKTDR